MQDDRRRTPSARERNVAIIAGIVLLLVLMSGGGMMGGMGMMFAWPLLLIVGVVIAVWLGRGDRMDEVMSQFGNQSEDRRLDILRERYARGEVTHEQYERMRRELQ